MSHDANVQRDQFLMNFDTNPVNIYFRVRCVLLPDAYEERMPHVPTVRIGVASIANLA